MHARQRRRAATVDLSSLVEPIAQHQWAVMASPITEMMEEMAKEQRQWAAVASPLLDAVASPMIKEMEKQQRQWAAMASPMTTIMEDMTKQQRVWASLRIS